jgi:ElaB/YqjD/DUF883 family membrane-anchored ribosome-binding protein
MEKARELYEEGRKEMMRATEMAKEKGEDALEAAQKKAREAWENTKAKSSEFWDDAASKSGRAYNEAREWSEDAFEDVEKMVRRHPSKAIGLSLLMGVIIGTLLARDRD